VIIPGVVFYLLALALVGFGVWRIVWSRQVDAAGTRKRYHLIWGVIWVLVGLWLLAVQRGWLATPRLGR
jgi:hypothetical protein